MDAIVFFQGQLSAGRSLRSSALRLEGALELCYEASTVQIGTLVSQVRIRAEAVSNGRKQTVASFYLEGTAAQRDTIEQPPALMYLWAECLQGTCQVSVYQVERELPQTPPNLQLTPGALLYVNPDTLLIETLETPPPGYFLGTNTSGEFGYHPLPAGSTSGGANQVWNEVPDGILDGINAIFTLQHIPYPPQALMLFKNGMLLKGDADYQLSGHTITYNSGQVPDSESNHLASYPYI